MGTLLPTINADIDAELEDSFGPLSSEFRAIGGSALDRLFLLGRPLLADARAGARLFARFSEAKEILSTINVDELLACIMLDRTRRRALTDITSRLEHVGLVIPEDLYPELGWAASRAGFPDGHATVSSVVVARELGALIGQPSVPTTIFKAYGPGPHGRSICIEVFVPHGVARETAYVWVAKGVGVHVAIKTKTIGGLETARRLFESEGYAMPLFMNGKPITNAVEETTVLYFDRAYLGRRLRVECSWSPEAVW